MWIAQILVVAVAYATLLPAMRKTRNADGPARLKAGFTAAVQRFLATLMLAVSVAWGGNVQVDVFLTWVAITYLVMVKIETAALVMQR
jgi:hypothetical protein